MKAMLRDRFGIDAVGLRDAPVPEPADDQVLVRVRASSVNPLEWYVVTAPPFLRVLNRELRRPKDHRLGVDAAGTIESVGRAVTGWEPGDEVFGSAPGAWAEYAVATATRLTRKPEGLSFEDAAAIPIAGLTALQAVRDVGAVEAGQKVLINGASGGVGTYAVQLAKAMGADVTAVCSTRNVELARSLGADRVIDYRKEDFTTTPVRHDVMIDIAGSRSLRQCRPVLASDATVAVVGAKMSASLFGPLTHIVGAKVQSIGLSQKVRFFVTNIESDDLAFIADLMSKGKVRSVIDRRYELGDAVEAIRYLGEGHAQGKIVIHVEPRGARPEGSAAET